MKLFRLLIPLLAILFFLTIRVSAASAATLSLDPVSASAPVGQSFNVKLTIDTEGESVTSTDVILLFDDSILQVLNVVEGDNGQDSFFPRLSYTVSPNELYIPSDVIESIDKRTGTGVVGTITFQGSREGIADVQFDCTAGKTSDTNIMKSDKNSTDIVDCSRLVPGRYTIGSGLPQPTSTPAVGGPPLPTATPLPPQPVSGSFEVTTAIIGLGILLIIFAFGGKMLFKI